MSLRLKLLIAALSTLALPWLGWSFVARSDETLRLTAQSAMTTTAAVLADALATRPIEPLPEAPVVAVHRRKTPIRIDGYADDWPSVAAGSGRIDVQLADDGHSLYALVRVRDGTRQRADARDPQLHRRDHVVFGLALDDHQRIYRLASAGPGRFESPGDGDADDLPELLTGEWQEDGSGYRIELRLPRSLLSGHIGWRQHDAPADTPRPDAGIDNVEWRDIAGPRPRTTAALGALARDGLRLRLVSANAVVLADSGESADTPTATDHRGWLSRTLYQSLTASAMSGSTLLDGRRERLDAGEIWQALSGIPAASWRPGGSDDAAVLAVAMPLRRHGDVPAVLLVEQVDRLVPMATHRALSWLGVASLAATTSSIALLLVFGAWLSRRVRRLRDAVDLARRNGGRLGEPMPLVDDRDELGDLARSFQRLGDEVAAWTDYLRSLTSRLSHELHTPLAIVKSSLDNLEQPIGPEAARGYLDRARDGSDRLAAIVRAMSESHRIERMIASADAEDLDLVQLVAGCSESYRPLAGDRELVVELPQQPLPFHGAPELLAQALDKLFDNARSFAPAGGWIRIALDGIDNGDATIARLRVANQGPKLPAAMQDRLFDTLVSVRERSARGGSEVPHLGLGLYVVKLVAELHRGEATASNLPDGNGVEFTLRLRGMPRRRLTGKNGGDA